MKTKIEDLKTHPNSLSKASYAKWMPPESPVRDGVTFPFFSRPSNWVHLDSTELSSLITCRCEGTEADSLLE